jgi:cation diffusion facilitator family transporter
LIRSDIEHRQAMRSTWVSVWVNLFLAGSQIGVGYLARSQALIADGIHSLSDLLSDGVVLLASRQAAVQADAEHSYGHARFETAASLAIGLILLATGCGMVWSAGLKLHAGTPMDAVHPVALAIALGTLIAKEFLFRYMRRIGERLQSSLLIANAWHARADAASSLVVALGIGANLMGYHSMDVVAAVIVGFMIAKAGWGFSVEAFHALTDHALDSDEIERIRNTVAQVDGVLDVHGLRTRRMGDWAVIDMHVGVGSHLSVSEGHYIAETISADVRRLHRVAECTVHIDPSLARNLGVLLQWPARHVIEQQLAHLLPKGSTLRLHYLDAGLELDLMLTDPLNEADQFALQHSIETELERLAPGSRLRLFASLSPSRQ